MSQHRQEFEFTNTSAEQSMAAVENSATNAFLNEVREAPPTGARSDAAADRRVIEERQTRLSNDYGIVFPRVGQRIEYDGQTFTARLPNMQELDCLSDVLHRNEQMNVRNMRFAFLNGPNSGLWGVYQHNGNEGNAQMLIMPRNSTVRGWNALEGTLQHELVHHEQSRRWGEEYWGARNAPSSTRQLLRDMGWVYNEANNQYRLLDRDGVQYQRRLNSDRWDPVIGGHPTPERSISNSDMRARAQVKPATEYFSYPWEMHAEALAMFRHDRRQLWREDHALYDLMKRYDQEEINRRFGLGDGQPRMIRGANQEIVPNTQENRDALQRLERSWRTPQRRNSSTHEYPSRNFVCGYRQEQTSLLIDHW